MDNMCTEISHKYQTVCFCFPMRGFLRKKKKTVKRPGLLVSRALFFFFCTAIRFQRESIINFLKIAFPSDHRCPQHAFGDDCVFVLLLLFEVPVSHL